jgi:hypothetical protein
LFDYTLGDSDNAVGIERFHRNAWAALITSERERLEQTVIEGVPALLTFLNRGLLAVREARDFLCQQLVPQFPAQPGGELSGDSRRPAAVFPLDCDDSDHGLPNALDARLGDYWTRSSQFRNLHNSLSDPHWLLFQSQFGLGHNSQCMPLQIYEVNPAKLTFLLGAFILFHVLTIAASHLIHTDAPLDQRFLESNRSAIAERYRSTDQ